MKIFIVVETEYQYNDEYYYEGDVYGGKPVIAYKTEKAAKEAVAKKTEQWLKTNNPFDFGYGSDVVDLEKFAELSGIPFAEIQKSVENWDTRKYVGKIPFEAVDLTPYKVMSVEVSQ